MRPVFVLLMLGLLCAATQAATVGYLAYGGDENAAVDAENPWVVAMRDAGLDVVLCKTTELANVATMSQLSGLYVPNVIALTEGGLAALQRYVGAGGWLLLDGYYAATAVDQSGEDRYVKGKFAWRIVYLEDGACRSGILPATGAGAMGQPGIEIEKVRVTSGPALTEGAETGTVLEMPKQPNGKPYPCAGLYYFRETGSRPLVTGVPPAKDDTQTPEPVVLATYNEYGAGKAVWATAPLAQMAADGVEFAAAIVGNIVQALLENPPPDADALGQVIPTVEQAMQDLKAYDAAYRGGKGDSASADSSELGWGEAARLLMYIRAYRVSGDAYWLDKIIDHVDRMVKNLSDPDEDGYLGWRTIEYSDALGWPSADDGNKGAGRIEPELVRARKNTDVTGHTYYIQFTEKSKFDVVDLNGARILAKDVAYTSGAEIAQIPGIKVTISGNVAAGDKFKVRTEPVLPLEWTVHDGMITYPIALFVETVRSDDALAATYGEKADEYAELLCEHFLKKWEYCWVEVGDDMGFIKWEPLVANPYLRRIAPGDIPRTVKPQPHNQYLALGRTYLVMSGLVDEPLATEYRDRAERMARFFLSKARETGNAYTFSYGDEVEGLSEGADDFGHGGLSMSFCIEAANRGVVFSDEQMQRFSHTLLDQIWDGSVDAPTFADRVSGEGERTPANASSYWVGLSRHNDEVWRLFWHIFRQRPDANAFLNLWYARPEVAPEPPAGRGRG